MLDQTATDSNSLNTDLIVVGGGLAGLIAAAKVAQAGRSVMVLEHARHLGGRAITTIKDGRHLNLGAHALYCGGHAFRLLKELQVPFTGAFPNGGRAVFLEGKTEYGFPVNAWTLITSGMLTLREKWIYSRLISEMPQLNTESLQKISIQTWIEQQAGNGHLAALLRSLFRLNTFCDDGEQLSAAVAIEQFQIGLAKNVWYLDGGWQSLVAGLQGQAEAAGTKFRNSASVKRVQSDTEGVTVTLANGEVLRSRNVILAVPPEAASKILNLPEGAALPRWAEQAIPVRVACLDVCLDKLTRPEHRFALGLDRSVYFSVHSAAAKLAPDGIAVVHLMKYLREDVEKSYAATEVELEEVLDQMQPDWRAHTVERRFLPGMIVSHCLPTASEGGLAGRPAVRVEGMAGVYLAGDWVGARGMLADASAASAEEAASCVLKSLPLGSETRPVIGSAQYVGT